MGTSRFAFSALLKKVNPGPDRIEIAKQLPGEVRVWLQAHDFKTATPHSRLIGSYGRQTAVTDIKDVDTLVFLPATAFDRSPESVLRELKSVLVRYPDTVVNVSPQRRSIRVDFALHKLRMDLVAAVAREGIEKPLMIPDRHQKKWISSDPLGYGRTLSEANGEHGNKLVPLIKLVKAWRDEQMVTRRPKSYLLEVIVLQAVRDGRVELKGHSTAENVVDFFEYISDKFTIEMNEGDGVPRITDPQLGFVISTGWERTHFETFMRRVREAASAGRKALDSATDDEAAEHWEKVCGGLWPTRGDVAEEARQAAAAALPGTAYVESTGALSSTASAGAILSRPTTFHGAETTER
jgi:hypothetical protein